MRKLLFTNTSATDLGILRAAVFGIWFIMILFSPIGSYAHLPIELFEPWGLFRIIFSESDSLTTRFVLSEAFLLFLKTALLVGCFLCMAGVRPFRWIAVPTVLLLFIADGITKGFNGYVNHAELIVLYASLMIVLFPSADGFSISKGETGKKSRANYEAPVFAVAFILCASYTFISVHRLLNGGLDQFFNQAMDMHLIKNSLNYSKYGFDFGLFIAASDIWSVIFREGFFLITIFEALSLFILVNRRFRLAWLCVIIPFHLLSLFTMSIFFWENLVLIVVLFVVIAERPYNRKFLRDPDAAI